MDGITFQKLYVPVISNAVNIVSIVASSLVLIIAGVLRYYKPNLMDRVTLRLQIGISLFDLLTHVCAMFHHLKDASPSACIFIAFYRGFGNMVYCFLNIAIALNLQLVFLHSFQPKRSWEIGYWVAALGLSFLSNIIPYAYDLFGLNADGQCFLKANNPASNLVLYVNINGSRMLTCAYCLVVSIFVIIKLLKNVDVLKQMRSSSLSNTIFRPKLILHLKKLVFRVSLYPILCFLSLSGAITRVLVTEAGGDRYNIGLILWSMLGLTTTGLFNLVAFCLDPTLHNAIIDLYYDLRHKYNIRKNRRVNSLVVLDSYDANHNSGIELKGIDNDSRVEEVSKEPTNSSPSIYEGMNQEDSDAVENFKKFL